MRLRYEERIFAFIDILGFKEKIINTTHEDTGVEKETETDEIDKLYDNVFKLKNELFGNTDNFVINREVGYFSDSIAISYLLKEEAGILHVLAGITLFFISILHDGYLIRGAITYGKLHHSGNKLFGPAMLTAYDMERKLAFYPRIVIEKNIIDIAEKYSAYSNVLRKIVKKDFDGLYYLDYFGAIDHIFGGSQGFLSYFQSYKRSMDKLHQKIEKDLSIKSKYLWLKEKYNAALRKSKKIYYNEKTKIECFDLFEFLENEIEIY